MLGPERFGLVTWTLGFVGFGDKDLEIRMPGTLDVAGV